MSLVLAAALVHAGTLEDMELRSNVETYVRGTAQTANLHLKIEVENGVAIPEGPVRDLNQADAVVDLASKVTGITGVDRSRLRLEFAGPGDDAIAARIVRTLSDLPGYASPSTKIDVKDGVVTLAGSIKYATRRAELRKLCGAVEGVIEVVDHLDTPETADDRVQKALDAVFGPRVVPRFPGHVKAQVKDGAVVLVGRVPRLYDKLTAERRAWGINGVRLVDNRLELGWATAIQVIRP